jgi:DNA topoisomerase VI subunit B
MTALISIGERAEPDIVVTKPNVAPRHIFKTSRLAEFCSQKELINQTGHNIPDWPLVILKELLDNALDASEEAGIAPETPRITLGSIRILP